jgi:sugar (pentulose or hexulose) kinase
MKVFVGGIAAAFLGLIGILIFFGPFLQLLAGAVPAMLLLGGAMAAYLGFDEVKDKLPLKKKEEVVPEVDEAAKYREEASKYKEEVEKLKAELEKGKS